MARIETVKWYLFVMKRQIYITFRISVIKIEHQLNRFKERGKGRMERMNECVCVPGNENRNRKYVCASSLAQVVGVICSIFTLNPIKSTTMPYIKMTRGHCYQNTHTTSHVCAWLTCTRCVESCVSFVLCAEMLKLLE